MTRGACLDHADLREELIPETGTSVPSEVRNVPIIKTEEVDCAT